MEVFVNREEALQYIEDAFETLRDKRRLLRTPIINFHGAGGIGKTLLLKKIQQRSQDERLRYIWLDGSQNITNCTRTIIQQVQLSGIPLPFEERDDASPYQTASAIRILLKREPVVMLFDMIDIESGDWLSWLVKLLRELTDDVNLFAVLSSRRTVSFENERSLMRKLTTVPLPPFDRFSCEAYLNAVGIQDEPEIRSIIFKWTRGYPLAVNVMAEAIKSGLDPYEEEDRKEIIARLTEQVLNQCIFSKVGPADRVRYLAILSLLSIPRNFNLVLIEDLIKKFLPVAALGNSLAYFGLPREINYATGVLNWSPTGTGISVDAPVRAIFLLKLSIEQLERYFAIHSFLAQTYWRWAANVSGTDQIHYLCERLYHIACSEDADTPGGISLTSAVEEIVETFPQSAIQLADKIVQDADLIDLLGKRLLDIKSLLEERRV